VESGAVELPDKPQGRASDGRIGGAIIEQHILFERRERERKNAGSLAIRDCRACWKRVRH
jgi:hypothetical protein